MWEGQIVTDPEKADAILSSGMNRQVTTAENREEQGGGYAGSIWTGHKGTVRLIDAKEAVVVWSHAASDNWSMTGGATVIAKKLANRFCKDHEAALKKGKAIQ